jgi:hypothetical protein
MARDSTVKDQLGHSLCRGLGITLPKSTAVPVKHRTSNKHKRCSCCVVPMESHGKPYRYLDDDDDDCPKSPFITGSSPGHGNDKNDDNHECSAKLAHFLSPT